MTLSYLKNKQHIYNWREKNREEWNDYMRDINRKQYIEHKDKINQKRNELNKLRRNDLYFAQCEVFRKIKV
jgi:exopolysaccharide biosynthesis predicted pyruvyltransferase EpsI